MWWQRKLATVVWNAVGNILSFTYTAVLLAIWLLVLHLWLLLAAGVVIIISMVGLYGGEQ
jgi:hypothetical protein